MTAGAAAAAGGAGEGGLGSSASSSSSSSSLYMEKRAAMPSLSDAMPRRRDRGREGLDSGRMRGEGRRDGEEEGGGFRDSGERTLGESCECLFCRVGLVFDRVGCRR